MNKKMRLAAVAAVPLAAVLFLAGCATGFLYACKPIHLHSVVV